MHLHSSSSNRRYVSLSKCLSVSALRRCLVQDAREICGSLKKPFILCAIPSDSKISILLALLIRSPSVSCLLISKNICWEGSEHPGGSINVGRCRSTLFLPQAVNLHYWTPPSPPRSPHWYYQCRKAHDTVCCSKKWPGFKNCILALSSLQSSLIVSSVEAWFRACGVINGGDTVREDADVLNEIGKQGADLESGIPGSFSALLLSCWWLYSKASSSLSLSFLLYESGPQYLPDISHSKAHIKAVP